jgi:beta-galactosidase/beta-glucuronidase
MADTGIFATTAEVQRKAGAYANSTATTEAYINDFMTQAESYINVQCQYNFSDVYSSLNVDVKGLLKEVASSKSAMYCLNYDLNGFASLAEAQTVLNVLDTAVTRGIELLKEKSKNQAFLISA